MPLGTLAIIAFAIAAIMEGKNTMKRGSVIRSLYFYLASLITLAIVVGSVIFLMNLGLKVWVFTEANTNANYYGPPPSLTIDTPAVSDTEKPVAITPTTLQCADSCILTETQKSNISSWKSSYTNWKEAAKNPNGRNARDAVAALSFLIIAAPFFFIHYRIVQRDAKQVEDSDKLVIRPVYFYFVSLGSLLMIVIAGGFLINLVLKTWVFPSAGQADQAASKVYSTPEAAGVEKSPVLSVADCGEKCGLDAETVTLAKEWSADYDTWQSENGTTNTNTQRQAASAIPFVAVGIPLLWYHWTVVRKEAKEKKGTPMSPTPTPAV